MNLRAYPNLGFRPGTQIYKINHPGIFFRVGVWIYVGVE
jgi:hypothetical protein